MRLGSIRNFVMATNTVFQASTNANRGAFILFEGVDRCGKSTQSKLLTDYCREKTGAAELIRFPERSTAIGQLIDSYLKNSEVIHDNSVHLLFSANRWESANAIAGALNDGVTLVCDRYAYSGVAFTSAKGLDLQWCKHCDSGLPAPDCIIFMDLDVEDASQRGNYGEERYERIDFQRQVKEKFLQLKTEDEAEKIVPWHVLDGRKSIEELQQEIQAIADKTIVDAASQPIKKLWS